ncbi:MAG: hypothetical protein ACE5HB_06815 [Terriglobia bacterium]
MINAGRWVAVILFALDAAARVAVAVALMTGLVRPDLSQLPVPPPPGMGDLFFIIAGVFLLLWAVLTAAIAWGLYRWRNWARLLAVAYYLLALLLLVIASFMMPLTAMALVNGVIAIVVLFWLLTPGLSAAFKAGGVEP